MRQYMVWAFMAALVFYQAWVTFRVFRADGYTRRQQWLQTWVIWLIPLLGAWCCHFVLRSERTGAAQRDRHFVPQVQNAHVPPPHNGFF